MNVRTYIFFKKSVLDPQGQAVMKALQGMGFEKVKDVRQGKVFDLEIESEDKEKAFQIAKEACEKLLCNPIIESYEIGKA